MANKIALVSNYDEMIKIMFQIKIEVDKVSENYKKLLNYELKAKEKEYTEKMEKSKKMLQERHEGLEYLKNRPCGKMDIIYIKLLNI